eukprot:TRINITY_DN47760_c0_g1_i1.p1 TRINITY_DN47760_c0_g1~~TRINITY_DN47760_c0_g1_i1.p1  ORF type:complete len:764 (-),score=88.20 TRINITY_DN47760_c0_g1_i1:301-2592(-)
MAEEGGGADDADVIRLLVATDNHVGYNEKDKVRGSDALNTFEEMLQIAKAQRADFILHGGDLFHDNKPSRQCLYRTMDLLRRYCLGPGEVSCQVVSDPSLFSRGLVNYEDPNVNVELPVFMIHGNHDDPGGESNLSAANILEMASLLNYFGRADDLEDIVIRPVLIRKGQTQIAIYGLGNIRDERLNRAFQARKVRFETPANTDQWFNIMLIHQNRHKGSKGGVPNKSCIHEQMLPSFLDLVIWGHEHDCQVNPQESLSGDFYVVQPGSSVATSLTPGEAAVKHAAVIELRCGSFRVTPVPLLTVRPLAFGDLVLSETGLLRTDTQAIWSAIGSEVEKLIQQGDEECRRRQRELTARGGHTVSAPQLPLVRLRVEHSGFETISTQAFGQQFVDRIANPDEVLLFHRRGGGALSGGSGGAGAAARTRPLPGDMLEIEEGPAGGGAEDGAKIQDIIYKYIEGAQNLQILSEPDLNDAVQSFVHRAEPCAIERFVRDAVDSTNQAVLRESHAVGEEEIRMQIESRAEGLRQRRLAGADVGGGSPSGAAPQGLSGEPHVADAPQGSLPAHGAPGGAPAPAPAPAPAAQAFLGQAAGHVGMGSQPDFVDPPMPVGRGRGRGRGRGGRGAKRQQMIDENGDDAFGSVPPAKAMRGSRGSTTRAVGTPAAASAPANGGISVRERLLGGSQGLAAGPGTPGPVGIAAAAGVGAAATTPAATPFLRKRGPAGGLGEPAFGPDTGPADAGASLRMSQTTTKRQWALRGPTGNL